jgi:hypothetical protein
MKRRIIHNVSMSGRPVLSVGVGLSLALSPVVLLSGCASGSDTVADLTVSPGKYMLYKCPMLKQAAQGIVARQHQLEQLMQKAGNGPAGRMVSTTTYEPEYVQNQGNLNEIRRESAAKQCGSAHGADVKQSPPAAKKPPHKSKPS